MVEKLEFCGVTHVNSFGRPILLVQNSLLEFSCSCGLWTIVLIVLNMGVGHIVNAIKIVLRLW